MENEKSIGTQAMTAILNKLKVAEREQNAAIERASEGAGVFNDTNIIVEKDGLYQIKDNQVYPTTHPDLSTQPSILPQRFGNLEIKEVLIANGREDEIPQDAMIIEAFSFNKDACVAAVCKKGVTVKKLIPHELVPVDFEFPAVLSSLVGKQMKANFEIEYENIQDGKLSFYMSFANIDFIPRDIHGDIFLISDDIYENKVCKIEIDGNYIRFIDCIDDATFDSFSFSDGEYIEGEVKTKGWSITNDKGIIPDFTLVRYVGADNSYYYTEEKEKKKPYFTIESLGDDNVIGLKIPDQGSAKTVSVSTDGGNTWTEKTSTSNGVTLATLNTGEKLLVKAIGYTMNNNQFTSTKAFNAYGNVMSLLYGDNFEGQTVIENEAFMNLLAASLIVSAKNMILPATTLAIGCYNAMFKECTSLTTAPELPATTLAEECYRDMFRTCTSLTTAPELPATTLAPGCYRAMFYQCSSLTPAPELPATTLAPSCYRAMLQECTSLTTAPELPVTTLAPSCYHSMFYKCTSLTTAPELPATTLAEECYRAMFYRCSSLTTAPELPATTLAPSCYHSMFTYTALTTAPELPATTLATGCYYNMFARTALTTAPELPATTLATECYSFMLSYCSALTTAPELPATTLAQACYGGMFRNCTSLTTAPELPATTLVEECYDYMFKQCSSLNYIKAMFTSISSSSNLKDWVSGVAASGTFVKNSAATWNVTGKNGVPSGWTVQTASE